MLGNGSVFVEESNFGRTLFFDKQGKLRWFHVNGSASGDVFYLGWSRILHREHDLSIVNELLKSKTCANMN